MPKKPNELAREMESLRTGLKGLAVDAHRENYQRLLERLDEGLGDMDNLKKEFSSFIIEVRSNREAIERIRMDISAMRNQMRGEAPPERAETPSMDPAPMTRDVETIKTRVKWLESKAALPNIENLRSRVEMLENQLGTMKLSVPTIIE